MNWRHKALTQWVLSYVPCGQGLNYLLSRYVTGHVPASEATFLRDFSFARGYLEAFRRHGRRPIEDAVFYEFGVGWDLIVALGFYALGVNHQVLVDLKPLLRPRLIASTASRLAAMANGSSSIRVPEELLKPAAFAQVARTLKESCGIDYRAPFDARDTGWAPASVDYVTSTKVLCHIPELELGAILRECNRILRADGIASFVIDYRDQYSYSDSNITIYNYLQFSEQEWTRFNPPLHYQNQLRHSDYKRLFEAAGFEIVREVRALPDQATLACIQSIKLSPRFANYELHDLAAVRGEFLLRKARRALAGNGKA